MEDGRSASGSMPTWPSSVSRRGEALASTSLGLRPALRPVGLERASSWRSVSRRGLSVRVSALISAALGEFMRCVFRGVDRARQCPRDAAKIKQSRWASRRADLVSMALIYNAVHYRLPGELDVREHPDDKVVQALCSQGRA